MPLAASKAILNLRATSLSNIWESDMPINNEGVHQGSFHA